MRVTAQFSCDCYRVSFDSHRCGGCQADRNVRFVRTRIPQGRFDGRTNSCQGFTRQQCRRDQEAGD